MNENTFERITATAIFSVSIFFLYISFSYPMDSRIFPTGVLGLMAILSAVVIVRSLLRPGEPKDKSTSKSFFIHRGRFLAAFGAILGYILLLPVLGYFTSSAIFFITLTVILGYRNWKVLMLTIGLFLTFVYSVFIHLFERPIPPEFFQRY